MSPDLRLATIYVMPLGGRDAKEVLEALERNKRFLRGEIAPPHARQDIELRTSLGRKRADRFAQRRQLLGVRRQGLETEQRRRVVLASAGLGFGEVALGHIAETRASTV